MTSTKESRGFLLKTAMEKHTTYFNLLDALKEQGCPICSLLKKSISRLMEELLYERVNDAGVRKEIRKSLGFCALHAWQLQKCGDGFGSSIIYEDLINTAAGSIEKYITQDKDLKDLSRQVAGGRNVSKKTTVVCPVCKARQEADERYVAVFIESFNSPEFYVLFKNSFGLCLPHLMSVIEKDKQKLIVKELLTVELEKMRGLIKEIKEFQRKHDYRFSKENFGKEGNSWIRAVEKISGKEGVF